ncbi:RDD family protein [[Mycoplasma] anseris]|uniref:RDD family protein n=1 Tax=[Mycoplasma] anseris TaxID=92400 RepID=A0A2Z4ND27_9BACT|nr:RDD family protein [[Mycoplasma] anseris]AWX69481.1 RDD family protein [[Mycoplasma] anseris]
MIKINLKANFWIRLLATLLDSLIFLVFFVTTSFFAFDYQKAKIHNILYYVWLIDQIIFLLIWYILIPIFWYGKTFGMWICRIKVIKTNSNEKFSKVIFDRQRLFAFLWMIIFTIFAILISPQTFEQAALIGIKKEDLTNTQLAFLLIPTILIGLASFVQLFLIITNARNNRIGLNDTFSNSFTVWINKYEEIEDPNQNLIEIKPRIRNLPKLEWKN